MASSSDFRIKKNEKGPLQRFKNQNLLLKKYGEVGLQVYKAITGQRTSEELKRDLGIDEGLFDDILNFMKQSGIIELEAMDNKPHTDLEAPEISEQSKPAPVAPSTRSSKSKKSFEAETAPEPEVSAPKKKAKKETKKGAKAIAEPVEIAPIFEEETETKETQKFEESEEVLANEQQPQETPQEDEIQPVEFEGNEAETNKQETSSSEPSDQQENAPQEEQEPVSAGNQDQSEQSEQSEEVEIAPSDLSSDYSGEEAAPSQSSSLSSVEKIIFDKYGDVGLKVYALIDGQRTAEEIMKETGLTEAKLVEILDFMDEQGIIKLDYPRGQPPASGPTGREAFSASGPTGREAGPSGFGTQPLPQSQPTYGSPPPLGPMPVGGQMPPPQYGPSSQIPGTLPPIQGTPQQQQGFVPMTESDKAIDESGPVPSPLEIPDRAPMDIVKSVQMKAKLMLKLGEKGSKFYEAMDGKNDVIDLALKLNLPLPTILEMLRFMLENGMAMIKPMMRSDVRKKYGEDGYAVYKRYGREGLMLYELIGKDLTIKQMAEKVTTDKVRVIEMFIFIHQVLGIELSIDKEVLSKQIGL